MIQESRKLAVLAAIALLIMGFSALIRVSRGIVNTSPNSKQTSIPTPKYNVAPDPSFFESSPAIVKKDAVNTLPKKISTNPLDLITAGEYLAGNVETGKIYLEKNSLKQSPVASMSKLITAIIATETLKDDSVIEISPENATAPPDGSGIGVGEKFTSKEILYPLLLNSSNIAAEAIASSGGDRIKFLEQMSSYAWGVGMPQAYFADPSGVDPHNQASANDIYTLAKYLFKFRPDILALTRIQSFAVATTSVHGSHIFTNIHPFVNDARFIGGKTGRTEEAGETMLTILRINNQVIAFVVMGSSIGARASDTRILIGELGKRM